MIAPSLRLPYVNRRRRRQSSGRSPVTVCISASAENHEAIVSCVDTKMTITGATSIEPILGRKLCAMRGWTILSSGTMCYAESLVDAFEALLQKAPDNDPPTIKRLLEQALLEELPKFGAAQYLTPYGIEMPAFLDPEKKKGFPDEHWKELARSILEYSDKYDVELIVSGWGQTQEAFSATTSNKADGYIFSASRDGVLMHSNEGFYTCGVGGSSAHSLLSFFNYEPHLPLARAVYFVAAAKFMSERTEGVGKNTVLRIARRTGEGEWKGYFIQPDELEEIRKLWEEKGMPRIPDEAEDAIIEMLCKHQGSVKGSVEQMSRMVNKAIRTARPSTSETSE
jgi:hypothetical protein